MGAFHNDYLIHGEPGCYPRGGRCTCPEATYSLAINLRTGQTSKKRFYCACCLETLQPDDWSRPVVQGGPAPRGRQEDEQA